MKKILIVAANHDMVVFGGVESYTRDTLANLEGDLYFLVASKDLYGMLPPEKTRLYSSPNRIVQLKETLKFNKEISPDCIIFNGNLTIYFTPFIKCRQKIIFVHNTYIFIANRIKRPLYFIISNICYAFADKIIHVSEYAYKEQIFNKKKGCVVYSGKLIKNKYLPRPKNNPVRFLFLGRIQVQKGIDKVIKAFLKLPDGSATLDIVGTGPYSDEVKALKNHNITYHGFQKEVDKFYKQADIFIGMSHHENLPLTILEAMECSMPIISTGVGGIPEMVFDGVNGKIINDDSDSAYKSMLWFCENQNEITRMGYNSYDIFMNNFDINLTLLKIQRIIDNDQLEINI